MNTTSTLLGNLLDTLRTPSLTSRRLSALRHVMRVACEVPTDGLCLAVLRPAVPRLAVSRLAVSRLVVPQSRSLAVL